MKVESQAFAAGMLAVGLLASASISSAQSADRVAVHGFGGWATGHTNNDNTYGGIASEDVELNNYYFALNVAAQPADNLSMHTQAFWGEDIYGKRLELDYAFAQWEHSPELKIRAGKVLSPLGIYTEIFDVGTLRPFILLPRAIYGAGGSVSRSYLGAGLTGEHAFDNDWEISYDLFGGEMRFLDYWVDNIVGVDPQTQMPIRETIRFTPIGRKLIGATFSVSPPESGLKVGVSYANFESFASIDGGPRIQEPQYGQLGGRDDVFYAHLQYDRNGFALKSELFFKKTEGTDLEGGYVEASWMMTSHWQVAGSYDWMKITLSEGTSKPLASSTWPEHQAIGAALNYWFGPSFVVKLNYYRVHGNFHARPDFSILRAVMGTLNPDTNVVIVGTQFSF